LQSCQTNGLSLSIILTRANGFVLFGYQIIYHNMNTIEIWLQEDNIHLNLKAESELEAIWTMLELAAKSPAVINTKQLAKSIYDNEVFSSSHRGTTGITFHALTDAVINPLMVVGHFKNGFGYYSKEKKPIDIVVLLAAPRRFKEQLKDTLNCVKDMLSDGDFLDSIRKTDNQTLIHKYFQQLCMELSAKKIVKNKIKE
jgi:mannitol/fructose-specific phosphotransferase system IIA component (Ntr-type)